MSDDRYDVAIVGGGVAGTTAAYLLAKEGFSVVLVERGTYAGSKNMTGGRLYGHALERIMPGFADEAPVERRVTCEKIAMLTADSSVGVDYRFSREKDPSKESYTVLSGPFDSWLADKAEEAGADIICGVRVDDCIVRAGKVCGVIADGEELEARVTLLADGVNSLLAQRIGLRKEFKPEHLAVGLKQLVELSASTIQDRFQCDDETGAACLFAGAPSGGLMGGGFLYTNKDSVSVGLVVSMDELAKGNATAPELLAGFIDHPAVKPYVDGGRLLEYSGHIVPEGGLAMVPELVGDGVLLVGDSACLCLNLGYVVRGMDLAIASAECAAHAVKEALERDDTSKASLESYKTLLDQSFVMQDMKLYQRFPQYLASNKRLFNEYPQLAVSAMQALFEVSNEPDRPLAEKLKQVVKPVGMFSLARDAMKGVRAL